MALPRDKQDNSNQRHQPEHHPFHANLHGFEITCSPPRQLFVQNKHIAVSKQRARKNSSLNGQTQSYCTLRWMYFLIIWSLALLCPVSAAVAAAVPTAEYQSSLLDVVAAPAIIIDTNPALSPVIIEEHHFELLNELVKEAVRTDSTPATLAQPHSHGRSLGTDWCGNGKPATGVHTLPRDSTCTFGTYVLVATGTSLELSSASGSGELAIISGDLVTLHFFVVGNLTLVDLILEKGKTTVPGGSLHVGGVYARVHLLRSIIRLCESTVAGGAVYATNGAVILLTNSTLESNKSPHGGGLFAQNGARVELTQGTKSSLKNNQATTGGGGIWLQNEGTRLDITGVGTELVVDGNTANSAGGVLANRASTVTVSSGASLNVSNNKAMTLNGGGFYLQNAGTRLNVTGDETKVVVGGNTAEKSGGGLCALSASTVMVSSGASLNMLNNKAKTGTGGGFSFQSIGARLDVTGDGTKVVVDGNTAEDLGGGVYAFLASTVTVSSGAHLVVTNNKALTYHGGGFYLNSKGTRLDVDGEGTQLIVRGNEAKIQGVFFWRRRFSKWVRRKPAVALSYGRKFMTRQKVTGMPCTWHSESNSMHGSS